MEPSKLGVTLAIKAANGVLQVGLLGGFCSSPPAGPWLVQQLLPRPSLRPELGMRGFMRFFFFSAGLNPRHKTPPSTGRARAACHSACGLRVRPSARRFVRVLFIFHAALPLGFCSLVSHCLGGSELLKVNVLKN